MRFITLLTDPGDLPLMLHDFDVELAQIEGTHRYLVTASERDFNAACDELASNVDPENFDMGDVVGYAEERLGFTSWDIASHSGLMALSRATSLVEVMLARMPAQYVVEPERWMFPREGLWSRQRESEFYKTVLKTPFKASDGAFAAMRSLRDLYAHGYGVPASEQRRSRIAEQLHRQVDHGPASEQEAKLGYGGSVYFFGWDSSFSPRDGAVSATWTSGRRADISPLATYRLLMAAKDHVHAAHAAVMNGIRDGLDEGNCKFIKTVLAEEDRLSRRTS